MTQELLNLLAVILQMLIVHLPALIWMTYRIAARTNRWWEICVMYAFLLIAAWVVLNAFHSPYRHPRTLAWFFSFLVCGGFFLAQPVWEVTLSPIFRGRRRKKPRVPYVIFGKTVTPGPLWWPAWLIVLVGVGLPVAVTTIFLSAV